MTTMTYRDWDSEKVLGFSTASAADVRQAAQKMRTVVTGYKRAVYDVRCDDILVKPEALATLVERFGFTPVAVETPKLVEAAPVAAKKVVYEDLGPDEGEFGIGTLHMTAATERETPQPVRGETMVCPCCHRTFERRMRMTTARGSVCPDCYDKWSE